MLWDFDANYCIGKAEKYAYNRGEEAQAKAYLHISSCMQIAQNSQTKENNLTIVQNERKNITWSNLILPH